VGFGAEARMVRTAVPTMGLFDRFFDTLKPERRAKKSAVAEQRVAAEIFGMSAEQAAAYLAGPEPAKLGVSAPVVATSLAIVQQALAAKEAEQRVAAEICLMTPTQAAEYLSSGAPLEEGVPEQAVAEALQIVQEAAARGPPKPVRMPKGLVLKTTRTETSETSPETSPQLDEPNMAVVVGGLGALVAAVFVGFSSGDSQLLPPSNTPAPMQRAMSSPPVPDEAPQMKDAIKTAPPTRDEGAPKTARARSGPSKNAARKAVAVDEGKVAADEATAAAKAAAEAKKAEEKEARRTAKAAEEKQRAENRAATAKAKAEAKATKAAAEKKQREEDRAAAATATATKAAKAAKGEGQGD